MLFTSVRLAGCVLFCGALAGAHGAALRDPTLSCASSFAGAGEFVARVALRVVAAPFAAASQTPAASAEARDGSHDFDFEFGAWRTHLKRLVHPLTSSTTWVTYDGTTTVTPVWSGRANLVQLEVDGSAGHIEGLSVRLYNPAAHQWSLNFSNSRGGTMGTPTVGEFKNGRGEFYDQEPLENRTILVRFVIAPRDANTIDFEQSFSADGGKTWEANWIATDTRVPSDGSTVVPGTVN